jgi:hypothetical protein
VDEREQEGLGEHHFWDCVVPLGTALSKTTSVCLNGDRTETPRLG